MNSLEMYFPHKTLNLQLEDFAFFNVEIDDTSNAKVLGQTQDYCWDDRCVFPPVKGLQLFHYNIFYFIYLFIYFLILF